jgi:hypothetical protein
LRIAKQQQRELVAAIDAQSNPNEFVNASSIGNRTIRRALILKSVPLGRMAPIKRALRLFHADFGVLEFLFQRTSRVGCADRLTRTNRVDAGFECGPLMCTKVHRAITAHGFRAAASAVLS